MALPKQVKKKIDLFPEKTGYDRRLQLLEDINKDGTYLPKSIVHEDLDRGFLDFVKENLKTYVDGKLIPIVDIIITTQNWAQFTQTWNFQNIDKNVEPPVITTVRNPEVKFGTLPSLRYNVPNRKQYYYAAIPNFNNGRKGYDVYTIPQPVPVDIKYSVRIICNRMRELNAFNKTVIEEFASRQAYTKIKGHYIPITLDEVQDESVMDMEKRKYYIQTYSFTLQGFLIDENEFEVKPGVSRVLTMVDVTTKFKRSKRARKKQEDVDNLGIRIDFPIGLSSNTQTFEYSVDLKFQTSSNISSYEIYVNNLYFGNSFSNISNSLQINSNDVLRVNVVKSDNTKNSVINLVGRLV